MSTDGLWGRLQAALAVPPPESRRLLHGRGGTVAGLEMFSVDWFAPVVLLIAYEPLPDAWWRDARERAAALLAQPHVEAVVVQRRDLEAAPREGPRLEVLAGAVPRQVVARRAGLSYELALGRGQNVGLFLDMTPGHAWLRAGAADAVVLNLFAYTCAFSVAAVAGGARRVVNLDMSQRALAVGQRNHRLNAPGPGDRARADVRYLPHDVFKSWGKLRKLGPYDRIVVDPPSHQFGSFFADRDYPRVLARLGSLAAPEARVLLCLNDPLRTPASLVEAVAEHAPELELVERLAGAADHPEAEPDRALKMLVFARRAR